MAKTAGVRMKLEDNGIGDVIEDEDQLGWSFFSGDKYIIGGFNLVISSKMTKLKWKMTKLV